MYSLVQHFLLVCAVVVLMWRFKEVVLHGGTCVYCGGHGAHRDDCPEKK